jgi:CRP-like cAMP-binding protein
LYLVLAGYVKITVGFDQDVPIVSRIVPPGGLFGELALLGQFSDRETADALSDVRTLQWTADEVEASVEKVPKLGIVLSRYLVECGIELQDRIESMALYKTPERTVIALLQLAAQIGSPVAGGFTRLPGLTHHTLAGFVGTSREIVTSQLNILRRDGIIVYCRQHIEIDVAALERRLEASGIVPPPGMRKLARELRAAACE